jgi:hypothetical protein
MISARPSIVLIALVIAACDRGHEPRTPSPVAKVEGANLKTLSHDDLMAVLHECHQYGPSDDPRVKYTITYCSAAQSRHSMEGYSTPSSAVVYPALNKMH